LAVSGPDFRFDIDDTRRIGARPDDDANDLGNALVVEQRLANKTAHQFEIGMVQSGTEQFADAAAV